MKQLPPEILLNIGRYATDEDLLSLCHCNKDMYELLGADYVWNIKAVQNYGLNVLDHSARSMSFRSTVSHGRRVLGKFPFTSVRALYWQLLRPYSHVLGLFQLSYPLYQGGLAHVYLDCQLGAIVAERIEVVDASEAREVPFSLLNSVLVASFTSPSIVRKPLFKVLFADDGTGQVVSAPVCTVTSRSSQHPVSIVRIDSRESSNLSPSGNGLWVFRSNRGVTRMSHAAEIINAMIQANHLPHNEDRPAALFTTSQQIHSFQPHSPLAPVTNPHPGLFSLDCDAMCHDVTLRNLRFNDTARPSLETRIYKPKYSKLSISSTIPRPQIPHRPKEGIWAGTYGGHGIELLLLKYALTESGQTVMNAYKITGDMNVPKGVISWTAFMSPGNGRHFGQSKPAEDYPEIARLIQEEADPQGQAIDDMNGIWWADESIDTDEDEVSVSSRNRTLNQLSLDASKEFSKASVYPGLGTIALIGFRKASRISVDVIVLSETELCVFFHKLSTISRFHYIPISEKWLSVYV